MELGFVASAVVALAVGIVLGVYIEKRHAKRRYSKGILHVDYGDPEDMPNIYLEPIVPVSDIASQKQVIFDVKVIRYISHE